MARVRTYLAAFVLSFTPSAAYASDGTPAETARLSYVAPDTCPDETSFHRLVTARLGYDPFAAIGATEITVTIKQTGRQLVGRASISKNGSTPAERALTSDVERCEPLVTALATSVAIAIEVMTPKSEPAPPSDPIPPPVAAPTVVVIREEKAPPPTPSTPPTRPPAPSIFGAVGAIGSVGLGPSAAMGPELGMIVRSGQVSGELSARLETSIGGPQTASGDRLDVDILLAAVAVCGHLGAFGACARLHAGAIQVRAPDVVKPRLDSSPFVAPAVRLTYTAPISGRFALRIALEGGLPLVRRTFDVNDGPIWTMPSAFGDATIAGLVRFQ